LHLKLLAYENHENSKQQNTNLKQTPMIEIQNSKQTQWSGCFGYAQRRRLRRVLEFWIWILFGIWDLGFDIWDFSFFFRQANYCYLCQLESTLTFPWG